MNTFKVYLLNNFQTYNTVVLTIVTMEEQLFKRHTWKG